MKRLSEYFYRLATPWVTVAAWVIFLLFVVTVLPAQNASATPVEQQAGIPDLMFYYTAEDLYHMAEAYGPQVRADFIRGHFTFDVVWPLVYTLFLMLAISHPLGQVTETTSRWRWLNLLPLTATLFDVLENATTSLVMWYYPTSLSAVAAMAGVFTALKWVFVAVNLVLLLIALTAWLRHWRRS